MRFLIQKSYMGLARGSEFHSESHLLDSLRVLDGFLRQDVNKEFPPLKPNYSKIAIGFVRFLLPETPHLSRTQNKWSFPQAQTTC